MVNMNNEFAIIAGGTTASNVNCEYDEEEDGVEGRILSMEEFIARIRLRDDIFSMEGGKKLLTTELITVGLAAAAGIWITQYEPVSITFDKPELMSDSGRGRLVTQLIDRPQDVTPAPSNEIKIDKKALNRHKVPSAGTTKQSGGGGDFRARAVRKGLFGLLTNKVAGSNIVGDIESVSGITDGIDVLIAGKNTLKPGSTSGVGRKALAGIGYGPGNGSGLNGGVGGAGDIDQLFVNDAASIELKPSHSKRHSGYFKPVIKNGSGQFTGGRNKSEIQRVVMQNLQALRYAYNKHLREKPGFKATITMRFAIDEFGNVLSCNLVSTTMHDDVFEKQVNNIILRWKFEKISKPGDITEIVYPFAFSS
jgi:hypothetical protein